MPKIKNADVLSQFSAKQLPKNNSLFQLEVKDKQNNLLYSGFETDSIKMTIYNFVCALVENYPYNEDEPFIDFLDDNGIITNFHLKDYNFGKIIFNGSELEEYFPIQESETFNHLVLPFESNLKSFTPELFQKVVNKFSKNNFSWEIVKIKKN